MKTFKFSLVHRTCENADVFVTLDENIYGIHSIRVSILYLFFLRGAFLSSGNSCVLWKYGLPLQ